MPIAPPAFPLSLTRSSAFPQGIVCRKERALRLSAGASSVPVAGVHLSFRGARRTAFAKYFRLPQLAAAASRLPAIVSPFVSRIQECRIARFDAVPFPGAHTERTPATAMTRPAFFQTNHSD
ncbi:hypothetical protein [Chitinasiproducens palmae]|uniref:hypothetical protein n=1 Tax=Chitinasiproducens palmae TaxID=1770053 RepID=UPI000B812520|nr:hypothetical protein [Chitinasiproducens palmae]